MHPFIETISIVGAIVLAISGGVLVELIDEDHDVLHAEVAPLEVLTQLGDDAREDQVLMDQIYR